ncbi:MAG: YaiO family outer membrane beta-barrel protein [Bacteroidales bacterium]
MRCISRKYLSVVGLVLMLAIQSEYLNAQINTDSLFTSAINDSQHKKYDEAISKAERILTLLPNRDDVLIFMANVYAWRGDYKDALNCIEKAYSINKTSSELYDSWLNILLWSESYKQITEISELAKQNHYPNGYNIVYKNAIAYKNLGEYGNGIKLIEENKVYLDSIPIKQLYIELYRLNKSGAVSLFYAIDLFDNTSFSAQHLSFIDYAIKIKQNTLIPRLNYANRFNENDLQVETDYYQTLKKRRYLYANLGMSINKSLFPKYSAGLELYFPLGKTWEGSFGGRYLKYDSINVFIITGNVNTYYKNFWFMVKPFFVMQDSKYSVTTMFTIRYYSANPINYWGLELLYGNSPDEQQYSILQPAQRFRLENYQVKIQKNIAIFKYHELKLSSAYSYEEYLKNTYRNRFTFEVLLKIRI